MKRDEILFLKDILESIKRIDNYSKNLTKEKLEKNIKVQDAIIRRIEIIGEAVKNISEETRRKYQNIEWRKVAGMRDVLTHAYFGVDIKKVWNVIKDDLPTLKKEIEKILKES